LQRLDWPAAALREERAFVAAVVPDTRQMSHQLTKCHRPLLPGEFRHVGLELVIEVQTASFEEQAGCG